MNNYRQKIKTQTEVKSNTKTVIPEQCFCKKCGAPHIIDENYCAECGNNLHESICKYCSAPVNSSDDICENCGSYQRKNQCSFCGADKDENDAFCCECGSPAAGIKCKRCGYISQFNFCPKCNEVLTEKAETERKKAEKDPKIMKIKTANDELLKFIEEADKLIKEIETFDTKDNSEPDSEQVSNFIKSYFTKNPIKSNQQIEKAEAKEELKKKKQIDLAERLKKMLNREAENIADAEEVKNAIKKRALEERKKVVKGMISELNALAIKENFKNAQQARDWFNARKIDSNNCVFNCNHANAIHPNPNHCGQPHKGGKWIYVDREIKWEDNGNNGYWKVAYL